MLKKQAAKGNNGILKSKYIIFGMGYNDLKEARSKLKNIEKDVIRNLNNIGTMPGTRWEGKNSYVPIQYFNRGTMEPFHFSFKELAESGKSVRTILHHRDLIFDIQVDFGQEKCMVLYFTWI